MESVLNILLHSKTTAIRYRTLIELLNHSQDHEDVKREFKALQQSPEATRIFNKMHPDGYWLQTNPRTNVTLGKGVEYGAYATTHYALSYLSELGFTRQHPHVEKAAERYLNLIAADGDWWRHMSCLIGYNIRTYIRLGYKNDKRLQKAIELMHHSVRADNGYLCDMHEKKKGKKSCYRGSLKVLLAYSELPEYWNHASCKKVVNYFLNRDVIFNSTKSAFACRDIESNGFPITWSANTYEALLALSKMGYGKHKALQASWNQINKFVGKDGLYLLHRSPQQSLLKAGKKHEENHWITFYVLLAKKHCANT